ncbi:M20 family metallopeptidase [Brevibacterium litoralis]|uniref:M20 family metallopeptidase n=1 Tax=Brevibacterium litoralis TaxID=3138935 RepID=UPI0032EFABD8
MTTIPTGSVTAPIVADLRERFLPARLPVLLDVAADIHAHPEIRFTEEHAAARLTVELETLGFDVQRGYADLPTAFIGRWETPGADDTTPTIAFFCEYDALEGIGHACGHNIIAASGLGAAVLTKDALEAGAGAAAGAMAGAEESVEARIVVIGSPGEEGAAGKVPMIEAGVLKGIDLALMIHPSGYDEADFLSLARVALDVDFTGRASHAAASPEAGINALDASTLSLTAIGLLRQQLRDDARVHTIVTDGGQAPNIIPEHTALRCFVRAADRDYLLDTLVPKVEKCFEGAAIATGCEVSIAQNTPAYLSMVSNPVLVRLAEEAFVAVGREVETEPIVGGSTDMGNVSQLVPSLHPMICLEPGIENHTREFTAAAGAEQAEPTIADGSVIIAATALAAFRDPALVAEARAAFESR